MSDISVGSKFHWDDAGIGAGVALGCVFIAGVGAALLARTRVHRRRLRHT
jgi:ABC-type Fe3+ transport system permease subunit